MSLSNHLPVHSVLEASELMPSPSQILPWPPDKLDLLAKVLNQGSSFENPVASRDRVATMT